MLGFLRRKVKKPKLKILISGDEIARLVYSDVSIKNRLRAAVYSEYPELDGEPFGIDTNLEIIIDRPNADWHIELSVNGIKEKDG
jgi:hypothetical protein